MNQIPALWPVHGFEDASARKRLAYFRPWIEDKTVRFWPGDLAAESYVRALAADVVEAGDADLYFAPNVKPDVLSAASQEAEKAGAAFIGWSSEPIAAADGQWHQESVWPFAIRREPGEDAIFVSAGSLPEIEHPAIGLAVPTHAHPRAAIEAIATMGAEYPGESHFALIANGVLSPGLRALRDWTSDHPDHIRLIEFQENIGYGRGCNAGLEYLSRQNMDFVGVMNDDVLPGPDCLFELVYAFRQLDALGHRPGAIGPVSNEINGGQRVELGAFEDIHAMKRLAKDYWLENKSTANQTLQLRGLLLLWSRECLSAVGGFDPRFGIGNFEDDDHNLRTRLAGFTLWIAGGSFLFHHGSSTFKSIEIDYEANIRRNREAMTRKWGIERLEEWIGLEQPPPNVSLYQPFATESTGPTVKINGETVDLIDQASDIEFAAWVMHQTARTPDGRRALVELLSAAGSAA